MAKKRNREPEYKLSRVEEEILTVLTGGRSLYGLEIITAVEEATKGRRRLGFGSLYPALHKLEKKSFLKSEWGDDKPEERGGARRKYYRLTALGQRVLRETADVRLRLATWAPSWERA
jgi:PadR family transcriptional regulator PadR